MRASTRSVFAWLAFAVVTVTTAFLLGRSNWVGRLNWRGWSNWISSGGTDSSPTTQKQISSQSRLATTKTFLSRDEARQRMIDLMQDASLADGEKMARFTELISSINPADIPDLIAALSNLPKSKSKDDFMRDLFQQLTYNPILALSLIKDVDNPEVRRSIISAAVAKLALIDPQKAVRALANLSPDEVTEAEYSRIFSTWGRTKPAQAVAAEASLPPGPMRDAAFNLTITWWVRSDPQAALNWALSQPPEDADALNSVVVAIGQRNPQLAESYLNQMTDASARNNAIVAIGGSIGRQDPAAALNWLDQMASGVTYDTAVNNIFTNLTAPTISKQILPNGTTTITMTSNQPDIPLAISVLSNVTDPAVRQTAIATIASNWSTSDPNAALTWAQTLPAADSTGALNSIITTWAKSDPAAAAAYVQNSADPAAFLSTDLDLAQSLAVSSPQAALAFADGLPEGNVKNQALNNVLVSMAQSDFTAAWTDAAALPADDNPVGIMTNLIGALASKNPAQAADIISQFPAGTAQDNAMSTVAAAWIQLDPQAFTVWLATQPPGDVRDTAIVALASSSQATKNPAGVLEWINTITNPQTKAALLQTLTATQPAGN